MLKNNFLQKSIGAGRKTIGGKGEMNKILATLLALVLLFIAIPALAANTYTDGPYTYEIKGNGTATIVGYEGSGDIIIPQMLDGYTVASIGNNAFYREEESTKQISVTVPETVKTIGDFAFWNMNVASINISNNVEFIGKGAFVGCNDCSFRISNNHPKYAVIDGALYDKTKKELIKGKEGIVIPEGILSIGDYACYAIGQYVWNGNKGMFNRSENYSQVSDDFLFPSTVQKIGDYAFAYTSFRLNDHTVLYDSIRDNHHVQVKLNESITEIGDYAFAHTAIYGYGLSSVMASLSEGDRIDLIIPASVKTIGEGCFKDISNGYGRAEASINIPSDSKIREIPSSAFSWKSKSGTSSMVINISAPVEKIGECAFANRRINHLNLEAVEFIGESAFSGANFALITIPETCKTISASAFRGVNLRNLILCEGVETIGANAFSNVAFTTVYLPSSLTDIAFDSFPRNMHYEVENGSYAQRWAEENAFNYSIKGEEQNLDWLNN